MSSDGQVWGRNVDEFQRRFDPKFTPQGPQRLRNLFFTLLVELRALSKVSGYLRNSLFYTGSTEEDEDTRKAMAGLLTTLKEFPFHFDETRLFRVSSPALLLSSRFDVIVPEIENDPEIKRLFAR